MGLQPKAFLHFIRTEVRRVKWCHILDIHALCKKSNTYDVATNSATKKTIVLKKECRYYLRYKHKLWMLGLAMMMLFCSAADVAFNNFFKRNLSNFSVNRVNQVTDNLIFLNINELARNITLRIRVNLRLNDSKNEPFH